MLETVLSLPSFRETFEPAPPSSPPPRGPVAVAILGHGELRRPCATQGMALQLFRGESGAMLEIPNGWLSISLPLSGRVRVRSEQSEWPLEPGRCLVWDRSLFLDAASGGAWLCLCGPEEAWHRACRNARAAAELFPVEDACPPGVAERLAQLAREARGGTENAEHASHLLQMVCLDLHAAQHALRQLLPRCPGRTRRRKRWAMLRLLRVRHAIASGRGARLRMNALAGRISCSSGHLSRVYLHVFGETPADFAFRLRLEHAMALATRTDMAFCDVAESAGFDNQSSFCRAFKKRYGMTPGAARALRAATRGESTVATLAS
ncbi:helix-turn-helix transcriptional regulator [Pseudoxanthomonas helianthi]|uniref:Helix-turn-helix transcriptional regulator n=1 Tax=Pseudoxanthomonas helianthi TaxID=1453541 RepID=A0A941ATK7_9GAMM|nr:helix-turn-helix transcriptional regulator [Pseudoxanthomonas helianthi]MBP3984299.1 helix-turn-helix transcriptional regulator [Pseudoxanthomonas helianthi]